MNNFQNRQLSQVGIFYSILISLCLFCFFSFPKLAYTQDFDTDQIIEKLKPYEAIGVDSFIYYASLGLDHQSQKRSMELFCEHVIPAFS